ncbi:MAG: tetratricopeptide repeat-containing sulfotransferase family protein [Phycisphaerales bacterium]
MRAAQPDPRLVAARRLVSAGDADGARRVLKQVLALSPAHAEALQLYANVCMTDERHSDAVEAVRRAVAAAPENPNFLCDLAVLVEHEGRHAEADDLLQRALALAPSDTRVLTARAEWLLTVGRPGDAERLLQPHAHSRDARIALTWALVCQRRGRPSDGADALAPHARDHRLTPVARRAVLFRLAALLDAAERYDEAFAAARAANAVTDARPRRPFDPAMHRRSVELLINNWSKDAAQRLPVGDADTEQPVFIVGMPRSGTSLVEQIIASHPQAKGAGERSEITMIVEHLRAAALPTAVPHMHDLARLTPTIAQQAATAYTNAMRTLHPGAARITDKRPDNFLHLGLISRLFPKSKVICIERNPLDVAVSCYFLDFYGPYAWADNLDHIGAYIDDQRRIMNHWRAVLDLDILTIRYEDLVDAPGIESCRLVNHIGLDWDDACLRFHENDRVVRTSSNEQVRRPVHTRAVERWRNYEDHLDPLLERFAAEVERDTRAA